MTYDTWSGSGTNAKYRGTSGRADTSQGSLEPLALNEGETIMPYYSYGRPVRPADEIEGVAYKKPDRRLKATPDLRSTEKNLDTEEEGTYVKPHCTDRTLNPGS